MCIVGIGRRHRLQAETLAPAQIAAMLEPQRAVVARHAGQDGVGVDAQLGVTHGAAAQVVKPSR